MSNSPLIILPFSTARLVLIVPTNSRSISVSTAISYKLSAELGAESTLLRLVKSIISANVSFRKILLACSITILKANSLSINIVCRGLYEMPYFCLAGNDISGILFPATSDPTRLSIHLFSNFSEGKLSATPSVSS